MKKDTVVLLDFDGTVTRSDVVDELLERFAVGEAWKEAEKSWRAGDISSAECLGRQIRHVRVSKEALSAFLGKVRFDPGFETLVKFLKKNGVPLVVLSDGFDLLIRGVFHARGVRGIPVRANRLRRRGARLFPVFPHRNGFCPRCAHCKGRHIARHRAFVRRFIFVGDGLSDRCAADRADRVFAKGDLARYCRSRKLPYESFRTLHDIVRSLRGEINPRSAIRNPRSQ